MSSSAKAQNKKFLQQVSGLAIKETKSRAPLQKNSAFKIAVVYTRTSKYYYPDIKEGFEACAKDYLDFGIEVELFIDDEKSPDYKEAQIRQLQKLQARDDIDGIVLLPFESKELAQQIDNIVGAGKTVVAFGSDISDSKRLCCVGPDGYKSGRIAAQILGNYVCGKGKVFVMQIEQTHRQTSLRQRGFIEKMNESFPDIQIATQKGEDLLKDSLGLVKDMIESGASGIFSVSANVYLIGQALKELSCKQVAVIGYDMSEKTQHLLEENYIDAVIFQNPKSQAYTSLKIMCDYLLEGKLPISPRIYSDVSILTSECL